MWRFHIRARCASSPWHARTPCVLPVPGKLRVLRHWSDASCRPPARPLHPYMSAPFTPTCPPPCRRTTCRATPPRPLTHPPSDSRTVQNRPPLTPRAPLSPPPPPAGAPPEERRHPDQPGARLSGLPAARAAERHAPAKPAGRVLRWVGWRPWAAARTRDAAALSIERVPRAPASQPSATGRRCAGTLADNHALQASLWTPTAVVPVASLGRLPPPPPPCTPHAHPPTLPTFLLPHPGEQPWFLFATPGCSARRRSSGGTLSPQSWRGASLVRQAGESLRGQGRAGVAREGAGEGVRLRQRALVQQRPPASY